MNHRCRAALHATLSRFHSSTLHRFNVLRDLLGQHQFGPAAPQDVIHLIEGVPDHHQTETTWSDNLITSPSAMQRFYWRLHAIIAKSHPHTIVSDLEREGDQLIVSQLVSVSNDIRARFIHTQHHQSAI